jgi:hypothetical protein
MTVPMVLIVHAPDCATMRSPCNCNKQVFNSPSKACEAHGGQFERLEIAQITPPAGVTVSVWRSQARRHRAISE